MDFTSYEEPNIQSPEDKYELLHHKALSHMNQCKNLDEFHDIVFYVEDTLIKANSLILMSRCDYFRHMLSHKYSFRESQLRHEGIIAVNGIPKSFFTCIIQYIYSDHFYIQKQEIEFFVKLLIYADYFMLNRLVDICSSYLKQYVTVKTVLQIMLIAHAHNADQLERFCINYATLHEKDIMESRSWRQFKRQAHESLVELVLTNIKKEREESYVQIAINQYVQKQSSKESSKSQKKDDSKSCKLLKSQFSFKEPLTTKLL